MDPNQSSTSSTECDRCQENIQKRCQVEEENRDMKRRFKEIAKEFEKLKKNSEEISETLKKAK